jgi:endoglucanase
MQRARGGYKTMTLSIPTRYIHTVTECIHKRDLQAAIDLLAAWLEA